jgi:hypothetical protein
VSRRESCHGTALSAPGLSAPRHARAVRGCGHRPAAFHAVSGLRCLGLFGTVAGPQQAELYFVPEAVVSKYPELQKL